MHKSGRALSADEVIGAKRLVSMVLMVLLTGGTGSQEPAFAVALFRLFGKRSVTTSRSADFSDGLMSSRDSLSRSQKTN